MLGEEREKFLAEGLYGMMTLRWKECSRLFKDLQDKSSGKVVVDKVREGVKSLIILKEHVKNSKEKVKMLNGFK